MLLLGLPQDSRLEWKPNSQFIFSDENPCTYAVLCVKLTLSDTFEHLHVDSYTAKNLF